MLKRLLVGLLIGFLVGAAVAAAIVAGLHVAVFGPVLAYAFAAATGVLVGLVAGKPIWAKGAQIEAGLKAFFGALLGAAGMFAVRTWLKMDVDLSMIQPGMHGVIGDLPAAALPLVAAVLGGFYELDNTGDGDEAKPADVGEKKRIASAKVRVEPRESIDEEDAATEPVASKKKR